MGNTRKQRKNKNNSNNSIANLEGNNNEPSLPNLRDHVIVKVLSHVPPEDLQEFRRACKLWNEMISEPGFVADSFLRPKTTFPVAINIRKLSGGDSRCRLLEFHGAEGLAFTLRHPAGAPRAVRSTCNGLSLLQGRGLSVVNLLTKCWVPIPDGPSRCKHHHCNLSLVFDRSARNYKVIHVGRFSYGAEIFTLGRPEWRVVRFSAVSGIWYRSDGGGVLSRAVYSDGQFLHWNVPSGGFIFSMDVSDGSTWKTRLPQEHYEVLKPPRHSLCELRGSLCLMFGCSPTLMDVWVLEDVRGQVWCRSFSIVAESIKYVLADGSEPLGPWKMVLPELNKLKAVCSLRDGEIIVFEQRGSLCVYAYETKLNEMRKVCTLPSKKSELVPLSTSLVDWESPEELLVRETI